jgi:hypothetical protein
VVNDSNPKIVILDVLKNNVPVPRDSLDLSDQKPERWTIVKFNPSGPIPPRIQQKDLPLTYAVCPYCRARAELAEGVHTLTCPECNKTSEVDWLNTC